MLVRDVYAKGVVVKAIKQIYVGIIDTDDVDGCAALKEVSVGVQHLRFVVLQVLELFTATPTLALWARGVWCCVAV
jgi:hypothetical protein